RPPPLHSFPTRRSSDLHRYLLGFALGLPLPADYAAGRHPAALVPRLGSPAEYTRARSASTRSTDQTRASNPALLLMAVYLSLLRSEEHTSELQSRFDLV